jgi:alpha-N-acetylglucosaminidase
MELTYLGNKELLRRHKAGVFCSRTLSGSAVLRFKDTMKNLPCHKALKIIFLFWAALVCQRAASSPSPKVKVVYDLIERVTPGYGRQFALELMAQDGGKDVYEIASRKGKVLLRGNSPVALATAYNQYLKYVCGAQVSWTGDQLRLPSRLPLPSSRIHNVIQGRYRVYFNYCTISYSAAWWDWKRWQREIDFMAMNAINMPLSVVGLEAVWYNTLLKYKFSDAEARAFLAGPAHAAWQWMQNLQSYGGPLPQSWIASHIVLGRQILQRELELGMQPIQQGFSGYVPRELKAKFPQAKIQQQPSWCNFKGVAQLDPTDPLFLKMGRDFMEEEKKLYGAYGTYAADPFHESAPPVNTTDYLSAVGRTIHRLMKDFDARAVWVMQAWDLREPIVKAVPRKDLLILDLDGRKSQKDSAFWGYPAIVGNLHNFGGRINLHGDLPLLASNQYARAVRRSPNICGSGLFMESIEQNPVYYDLAFEMPLHRDSVDLNGWLQEYARRRYGAPSAKANEAWRILLASAYKSGTNGTEYSSIVAARPALQVKKSGPNAGFCIPYPPQDLYRAEELLLQEAGRLGQSSPYRFDIVDIQRQLMSNLGQTIHRHAAEAFEKGDLQGFRLYSQRFLTLLRDMDELLRTRGEYNFDRLLGDARRWGTTEEEKNLFERDATALFTIWGGDGDPSIFDYGWKEWAGLIDGFYLHRWELFYDMLEEHLKAHTPYKEEGLPSVYGREAFRANDFYNKLAQWELEYVNTPGKERVPAKVGDEVEVARRMFEKYK